MNNKQEILDQIRALRAETGIDEINRILDLLLEVGKRDDPVDWQGAEDAARLLVERHGLAAPATAAMLEQGSVVPMTARAVRVRVLKILEESVPDGKSGFCQGPGRYCRRDELSRVRFHLPIDGLAEAREMDRKFHQ